MRLEDLCIHDIEEDLFVDHYLATTENLEESIERIILLANLAGRKTKGAVVKGVSVKLHKEKLNDPTAISLEVRFDCKRF